MSYTFNLPTQSIYKIYSKNSVACVKINHLTDKKWSKQHCKQNSIEFHWANSGNFSRKQFISPRKFRVVSPRRNFQMDRQFIEKKLMCWNTHSKQKKVSPRRIPGGKNADKDGGFNRFIPGISSVALAIKNRSKIFIANTASAPELSGTLISRNPYVPPCMRRRCNL